MSDETTNETTPEAPAEAPKETRGLFGRKRKKMTMKEQIQEIMPLIYVLIIGGIGYGIYFAVTYNWAPKFELEDQRYNVHSVDFSGEKPVVIAFTDRESGNQLQGWALKLIGSYGDKIESHRIADFSKLDPGIHHVGRGMLTRLPIPILIDYDGAVAKKYGFKGGDAALFVVAPDGTIKQRALGEITDEKWAQVAAALDGLLTPTS